MAKAFWYIGRWSLFQRLGNDQLAELEKKAKQRAFSKGSAIYVPFDSSDSVCLLAEGRIRICSSTPEGKLAILALIEPGEIFGELAVLNSSDQEERAEAAIASTVIMIPGDDFRKVMESSPELAIGITKLIGFRRARIERRLRGLLFRSNRERLCQLLVELAEQYGRQKEGGVELTISLSHQELASVIGSTRESVTMLLGELQLEGLISVARKRVLIRHLKRLAAIVQLPAPVVTDVSRSEVNAELFRLATSTRLKE